MRQEVGNRQIAGLVCFAYDRVLAKSLQRRPRRSPDKVWTANPCIPELGRAPFSWGRGDLVHAGAARDRYLAALRAADRGDIGPLLEFVRS